MLSINALHPQYIKDTNKNESMVVLNYNELTELIEDYNDLVIMTERRNEKKIPLEEFKKIIVNND